MKRPHPVAIAFAVGIAGGPAWAGEPVQVRMETHEGHGHVVLDFAQRPAFAVECSRNAATLRFQGLGVIPSAAGAVRYIKSVRGGDDSLTVATAPGARLRTLQVGNRLVVDVLPPPSGRHQQAAPSCEPVAGNFAAAAAAPPREPPPAQATATAPASDAPALAVLPVTVPPPEPLPEPRREAPSPPIASPGQSLALAAALLPASTDGSTAALLPFGPTVAAAAFRRGTEAWIVFDERRPLDLAPLANDPVFAGATVQLLPGATLLRLPLPTGTLAMAHPAEGWTVTVATAADTHEPLVPVSEKLRLQLPMTSPGQVVVVTDSETGQDLLVGPSQAAAPGLPVPFRVPEFTLLPSWQGVVMEAMSDRVALRSIPEGFAVETGDAPSPAPGNVRALESSAVLTRTFDFPPELPGSLLRRLQLQVQAEGAAAPRAKLAPREAVAQTMLALGLGPEAQSLLQLALSEEPRAASRPELSGLFGIAALLSGRPTEADGLLNPDLPRTDEVALWRAVRNASLQEGSPEAAAVFAGTVGLALSYPQALRNRLLPLAAETMAEGGAPEAADALLAKLPDEPLLALARAMRLADKGEKPAALALYDALASGRDRLASARAATAATLLRLAMGTIDPAEAANRLEHGFLDWRGDGRERDLRLRAADLRAQAGQWRVALGLMRETVALYPDDAASIQARMVAMVGQLLHEPAAASLSPLDLVALAQENAEVVAQSDAHAMGELLADKLIALDLPEQAGPVIERMAKAAAPGVGQAALGARLAALRLGEADPAGAAAALVSTDAPGLPGPLVEERGLLDARVHAAKHDAGGAAAILASLDSPAADELRATILANSGDWPGASAALTSLANRSLPSEGALSPAQQDLLLRLASAQARAGNDAALRLLGSREARRLTGPRGDMFRLLTAAPVSGVGDLRRAAGEVALARAMPASLSALNAH